MEDGLLSLKWNNHRSTFFHVLADLREKPQFSDVTLACDGELFPTHKLVLSTCSDYFAAMLESTNCKAPIIVLKDVKKDHLTSLLRYMYLGEAEVRQNDLSGLIKAAECLRIKGLAVPDRPPDETPTPARATPKKQREDPSSISPPPSRKRARRDSGSLNKGPSSKQVNNSSSDSQVPSVAREPSSPTPTIKTECLDIASPPRVDSDEQYTPVDQIKLEQEHEVLDEGDSVNNFKGEEGDCDIPVVESGDDTGDVPSYTQDEADMDVAGPSRIRDDRLSLPWQQEGSEASFPQDLFDSEDVSQQQMNLWMDSHEQLWRPSVDLVGNLAVPVISVKQAKYKCSVCPYQTPHKGRYDRHLYNHTDDAQSKSTIRQAKYRCKICNYQSHHKGNFDRHTRSHTGEKPFKCPYCSYACIQSHQLKSHLLRHPGSISAVASTSSSTEGDSSVTFPSPPSIIPSSRDSNTFPVT